MQINNFSKKIILSMIIYGIASCDKNIASCCESKKQHPDLNQSLVELQKLDSATLKDLSELVLALNNYKHAKKSYPISKNGGMDWNRYVYDDKGNIDPDWIPGLAPTYIEKLPADKRLSWGTQYVYKSNGAHYKLISLHPIDCENIKKSTPKLIDPQRENCTAYGFWTKMAETW